MSTRPVSENWLTAAFRGLDATLERLRADRQLDEALTCGPDPLHLAVRDFQDDSRTLPRVLGGADRRERLRLAPGQRLRASPAAAR